MKRWICREDLVAVYLFKKTGKIDKADIDSFVQQIDKGDYSLRMRIANVKAVATDRKKGLSHYAKQTKAVYDNWKNRSMSDIEEALKQEGIEAKKHKI